MKSIIYAGIFLAMTMVSVPALAVVQFINCEAVSAVDGSLALRLTSLQIGASGRLQSMTEEANAAASASPLVSFENLHQDLVTGRDGTTYRRFFGTDPSNGLESSLTVPAGMSSATGTYTRHVHQSLETLTVACRVSNP